MISVKEIKLLNKYQVLDEIKKDKKGLMYLKETINHLKNKKTYINDHRSINKPYEIDFNKVIIIRNYFRTINDENVKNNGKNNIEFDDDSNYYPDRIWMSLYRENSVYNCKNPFYFDNTCNNYLHITRAATGITLYRDEIYVLNNTNIVIQEDCFDELNINIIYDIDDLYNSLFPCNISVKHGCDISIMCY